ncbi:MAG: peptide-methionine (S)-S-oxide reductase MsrA [Gemmatimonadales bacterium]|jgi:peptide-methionine (S)-S-oxide reductase
MGRSGGISRGLLTGLGLLAVVALGAFAYGRFATSTRSLPSETMAADRATPAHEPASGHAADLAKATFAGGCFWCMEPPFDELEGVLSTTSGYAGGHVEDPTYEQVSSGTTGHRETVQIEYDPRRIDYAELLEVFWRNVDPTDADGQFCDRGYQYTTAIFYHSDEQRRLAEASKRELEESGRLTEPIATDIRPASAFYPAEEYHQDYYEKHPLRYKFYRTTCGRDRVLDRLWGE